MAHNELRRYWLLCLLPAVLVTLATVTVLAQETPSRRITGEELQLHDGKHGRPPYVAVDGKVYDVSDSPHWRNGIHENMHHAGRDLTQELRASPHGQAVMRNMVQVGVLAKPEKVPASLEAFLKRHPIFRRHPHPVLVHFPTVFLFGGAIFLLLNLFRPQWAPFEQMTFVMLIMGAIFTLPAIVTGLWSWWVVYSFGPLPQVFYKIVLSGALVVGEAVCLLLRSRRPFQRDARGWLYMGLMEYLALAALATGYFGGELSYGY